MERSDWRDRILESTRGRVLSLLRRSARTAGDLAAELGVTPNAVRLHLSALERDGLVEEHGRRREWTGKPAVLYRTTVEAEALYPKAYGLVLGELLGVLEDRHDATSMEMLLREAGARLGVAAGGGGADLRQRAEHAAAVLTGLGGLAEVHEAGADLLIQGFSCPLASLTIEHPLACRLAESLVTEIVGARARECCDRGERPRCAFRIAAA
ncbi:MAG TPA: helix-turn-helix domain-containing protein [Longimicrobiales bacterium]|nr:helix-turn-helix domain-containing protein [Longimicrobiales bacterium]